MDDFLASACDVWLDYSVPSEDGQLLHANAVSVDGGGLLIVGPSGAGKSSLTLQMIALGATLVADDRVWISRAHERLWAEAPSATRGKIEARHLGILQMSAQPSQISAVVELRKRTPRLPPVEKVVLCGTTVPLYLASMSDYLASALLILLRQLAMDEANDAG